MRTVEAGNHTKPTQLNPLCTELITIITATTAYPEKHKLGNFQNGGIFFYFRHCLYRRFLSYWLFRKLKRLCTSVGTHSHDLKIGEPSSPSSWSPFRFPCHEGISNAFTNPCKASPLLVTPNYDTSHIFARA